MGRGEGRDGARDKDGGRDGARTKTRTRPWASKAFVKSMNTVLGRRVNFVLYMYPVFALEIILC